MEGWYGTLRGRGLRRRVGSASGPGYVPVPVLMEAFSQGCLARGRLRKNRQIGLGTPFKGFELETRVVSVSPFRFNGI